MDIAQTLKDKWWLFALAFIFLFSYAIRAENIVPDRLLSFDPIYQYRFTYYLANWGHLPVWDELTYYVGRITDALPFMHYATAAAYWTVGSALDMSLMTTASYMSAIYGAMIAVAAFLLGREITNNYGGLLSAALIGTAPQILIRTFGSSYDTDQLVSFFILFTLFLGYRALKKKDIFSVSVAIAGFVAFMLTWQYFLYSFMILAATVVVYFILEMIPKERKLELSKGFKESFSKSKHYVAILAAILVVASIAGAINGVNIVMNLLNLLGFAQNAGQWIVNVSIAELQPFDLFSLSGWVTSMGNFATGDLLTTFALLAFFGAMIAFGIFSSLKKRSNLVAALLITILLVALYSTSRGIRFTEFTSSLFLILVGAGFGYAVEWAGSDSMKKTIVIGTGVMVALVAFGLASGLGGQLGPDIDANWDNAWTYLRTQTPELSVVGTWWDPGHMITGLGDRRVIADGAHCQLGADGKPACLYTINDRIVDLGKIMVTSNESESVSLIDKYRGDSPDAYWIASKDLIGKFQWMQYFGTGCNALTDSSCPVYTMLGLVNAYSDQNGTVILRQYTLIDSNGNAYTDSSGNLLLSVYLYEYDGRQVPILVQGITGVIIDESLYTSGSDVASFIPTAEQKQGITQMLKSMETQFNFKFSNQSAPVTAWVSEDQSYMVIIPQALRNIVFTKMFMLNGEGLEHFDLVFSNPEVKIFEVV